MYIGQGGDKAKKGFMTSRTVKRSPPEKFNHGLGLGRIALRL